MNYRYGVDKINYQDFRDQISREQASDRTRNIILAWLIGITYLLIGAFYWREWMAQCDLKMQAVWMLVMFTVGPILMGLSAGFSRLLGDWPRCPACGRKVYSLTPTLASKHCPHCHAGIIEDKRELSPGYVLPLTQKEEMEKKPGYTLSTNPESLSSMRIVLVSVPVVMALILAFGLKRSMELEPMMETMVFITGSGIIAISGIAPLISVPWMVRVCIFLRLIPKDKFIYCPGCGSIPSAYVARMSGCCSECGAKLLEIPGEPDTPEMLDWRAVKRYWIWNVRGIIGGNILMYAVFFPVIALKCWWAILVLGAVAALYFIQIFRLKKLAKIPKKCPHCAHLLDRAMWSLLHYGRCPSCRRKLVREEDDSPSGGTEAGK